MLDTIDIKIKELVSRYLSNEGIVKEEYVNYYSDIQELKAFVSEIEIDKIKEKREKHLRRIKNDSLCILKKELEDNIQKLNKCENFEEIHNAVKEISNEIKGIGELTIYDVSFKIAISSSIFPKKVYLHAGTRVGAKQLKRLKKIRLSKEELQLEMERFPEYLRDLKPYQLENFLCSYKDELGNITIVDKEKNEYKYTH